MTKLSRTEALERALEHAKQRGAIRSWTSPRRDPLHRDGWVIQPSSASVRMPADGAPLTIAAAETFAAGLAAAFTAEAPGTATEPTEQDRHVVVVYTDDLDPEVMGSMVRKVIGPFPTDKAASEHGASLWGTDAGGEYDTFEVEAAQ